MPELTGDQLAAFTTAFGPLCDALANSLSEGVNQLVACDPPAIEQKPLDALMLSVEPVLQTTFSYPGLCPDDALLLFSEADAGVIADLIAGGDGTKPAAPVDDDRIDEIAAAMAAVAQGLGAAIGSARGAPIEPGPSLATTLAPLTLPAAFLAAGMAVEIAIPFRIAGQLDSTLRLLVTPDLALAIRGQPSVPDDTQSDEAADAPEFTAESEGEAQDDIPFDAADLSDPSDAAELADPADVPDLPDLPNTPDADGGPQPMDLPSFETPAGGATGPDVFGAGGFGGFGNAGVGGAAGVPGMGGGGAFGGFGMAPAPPGSNPFQAFESTGGAFETMPRGMDLIMDIPLDVTVELGRVQMLIKDVLDLATGSIVELERVAGEPIDLLVNGQLIAKGEVVVIEDNFGIRITEIVSPSDRLNSVGKRG